MVDSLYEEGTTSAPAVSVPELLAVKETVASLMATLRNYGVFPPHHASTLKMVSGIHQTLTNHLDKFGDLGLALDREGVLYNGIRVYDDSSSDENPAFTLFRDGIRWLEFISGITESEVLSFFKIFNYYKDRSEDPEDDLVTVLWRADLNHIFYKASGELWDSAPVLDFSEIRPGDPEQGDGFQEAPVDESRNDGWSAIRPGGDDRNEISISSVGVDHELWRISHEEKGWLAQMVKLCVEHDGREEIVNLMLLILGREEDPPTYESILGFLKEEFQIALARKDFSLAAGLLQAVLEGCEKNNCEGDWVNQVTEKFLADISTPQILRPLQPVWVELTSFGAAEMKAFTSVLRLLPVKAGISLALMLENVKLDSARHLLIEVIASYAVRDHDTLAELLLRPEEDLVLRLLAVVKRLPDQKVVRKLLRQVAQHASKKARDEVQKINRSFGWY